ncbi:MAG: hypothetical protein ACE5NA_10645, partial [Nitrospiraceae bacterium]
RTRERAFRDYFQSAQRQRRPLTEVRFERGLLGRGEPLDAQMLSIILGREVKGAWRAGREATLVADGYPHTLGTAKRTLNIDSVHLYHWSDLRSLLIGYSQEGEYAGMGVLKDITSQEIEILTPAERGNVLQLGSLRVNDNGSHEQVRLSLRTATS